MALLLRQFLLLLICLPVNIIQADDSSVKQILIIKSADNQYYQKTLQVLMQEHSELNFHVLSLQQIQKEPAQIEQSHLVITLGIKAATFAIKHNWDIPKIHAYITRRQFQNVVHEYSNSTAVLLNQPLERHLRLIKILTSVNSIGIINQKPRQLSAQEKFTLQQLKLELKQYHIEPNASPLPALRRLLRENQVLLAQADARIYNRNTLKGILLTAYRRNIPMISYSPAHVKAGALASVYSSPVDIGKHVSELLEKKLHDTETRSAQYQYARYFTVATNIKVALSLGIKLPTHSRIIEFINQGLVLQQLDNL